MISWNLGLILFNLLYFQAFAEYRVFRLRIFDPEQQTERFANSNLDPWQYPQYYPLNPGEKIEYTATWMCRGRTDSFKRYCSNPKDQEETTPKTNSRAPADSKPTPP